FPGLHIDIEILEFEIPPLVIPKLEIPKIDIVPEIPEVDCSWAPSFSFPSISLYDVDNSLDNKNQFLSFKDKNGFELGSVRAQSVTDWRRDYFDGVFLTELMGHLVGIDLLNGIMGAITYFTIIADSHNSI